MRINVEVSRPEAKVTPLLALGIFENQDGISPNQRGVNEGLGDMLNEILKGDFQGKVESTYLLRTNSHLSPVRILLVGLGAHEEFTLTEVRRASGSVALFAKDLRLKSLCLELFLGNGLIPFDIARSIIEGLELALYSYDSHKTEETPGVEIEDATIILQSDDDLKAAEEGARVGDISARASILARDLANSPGNFCTPSKLSEVAKEMADHHSIKTSIIDKEEMTKIGMGGISAVSQGSAEPPKFIILEYTGGAPGTGAIFLVGKAVTFDTGGISIKPSDRMEEMKYDMSGGAAGYGKYAQRFSL